MIREIPAYSKYCRIVLSVYIECTGCRIIEPPCRRRRHNAPYTGRTGNDCAGFGNDPFDNCTWRGAGRNSNDRTDRLYSVTTHNKLNLVVYGSTVSDNHCRTTRCAFLCRSCGTACYKHNHEKSKGHETADRAMGKCTVRGRNNHNNWLKRWIKL
jgi:hypothetical protein